MPTPDINLLKDATSVSPQLAITASKLQRVMIILLTLSLLVGTIVAIVFGVIRVQLVSLENQKKDLTTALDREIKKEGLYASVRDRLGIAQKVRASQHSWTPVIELVTSIASPPVLTSLTLGEKGVDFSLEVPTVEEALVKAQLLAKEQKLKKLKTAKLTGFTLIETGGVKLDMSFEPTF